MGLWAAAASWIKEGPGCGRAVAELMSGLVPTVDVHEADAARFYPHQQTVAHVRGRAREGFNKMYGIVHPSRAVGVRPPGPGQPGLRAGTRAGRGVLRDRGLGAAVLVRVQRAAAGAGTRAADGTPGGMGIALVVAGHQRRAPGHAGRLRAGRPVRLRRPGDLRPGALDAVQNPVGGAAGRAGRPGGVHLAGWTRTAASGPT